MALVMWICATSYIELMAGQDSYQYTCAKGDPPRTFAYTLEKPDECLELCFLRSDFVELIHSERISLVLRHDAKSIPDLSNR